MRPVRRPLVWIVLAAIVGSTALLRHDVNGLAFVIRAADMKGIARRVADVDAERFATRMLQVPTARGPVRARRYAPAHAPRRLALLVSGLHPAGIDEPRLVGLAQRLAESGLTVVTPDIPELSRFEISRAITDDIEQVALWLLDTSGLSPDGRIALMGISFSGGLSIVAAGRPSLKDRTAFVFAFGGHDDLPRVLHYLCTGEDPPGHERFAPHDYGVAVILLAIADRVVPPEQAPALRDGIRRYLWASHLDRVDRPAADREFAFVRALAARLPEPSGTLLRYVSDRDVARLGPRLLPYMGEYGRDPALSVSRSPKPSAPVFLLHGTDDNVVPAVESQYLADDLRGHATVHLLLSGLISHAEADRPVRVGDVVKLAGFWGDLLAR